MYPRFGRLPYLSIWDAEVEVDVFIDSGNGCTEPLSGSPVHFVSLKVLEKHIPEDLMKPLLAWNPQGTPSMSEFPDWLSQTNTADSINDGTRTVLGSWF